MNRFYSTMVEAVGWSLLHFLWQGTAVALLLAVILHLVRRRSPEVRYLLAALAFTLMLGGFAVTLAYHWQEVEALSAVSPRNASSSPREGAPLSAVAPPIDPGPAASFAPVPVDARESSLLADAPAPTEAPGILSAAERLRPALPWIVAIWIGGMALFSLRLLSGWLRLRRWRLDGVEVIDPFWSSRFAALCESLRISRPVRLLSSTAVAVPIVMGWLKPVVLVPARLFTGLSESQLEAILAHELAHVRRHDYLVNLLQSVAETIFFFHPAVWWISARLRVEREHCCDDVASRQSGDAIDYARALTALEELRGSPAPSVAANGGSLIERVRRLCGMAPQASRPLASWLAGIAVTVVVAGLIVVGNSAHGEKEEVAEVAAPVVRGLSLEGIAVTPNSKGIPEAKEGPRFVMSVSEKEGGPRVIYPQGKSHFYLEIEDRTYGPIEGNPFEKLKLKEVLVAQLRAMDERAVYKRLFKILDSKDERVLAIGYELVPELKGFGFHGIVSIIGANVRERPLAATAEAGRRALKALADAKHAAVHDEAKGKWEAARVAVPDGEYRGGSPLGKEPPGIIWGDANEAGLRLGFSGLVGSKPIPLGRMLNVRLFVRNDGKEDVKFVTTSLWGVGLNIVLTDESGNTFKLERNFEGRGLGGRVRLGPDRFFECEFLPVQTILLGSDGRPATVLFEPTGLILRPGRYKAELQYDIGLFHVRADWRGADPRTVPAIGEWTGSLKAEAGGVRFGPPNIKTARAGVSTNYFDLHRLDFKDDRIDLAHRVNWPVRKRILGEIFDETSAEWTGTPWGGVADSWKVAGEYRAAMDYGAKRLWIVDDNGVQLLQYHHKFHDRGHWTMEEAGGELGDMPDGVRKALKLPDRAE